MASVFVDQLNNQIVISHECSGQVVYFRYLDLSTPLYTATFAFSIIFSAHLQHSDAEAGRGSVVFGPKGKVLNA